MCKYAIVAIGYNRVDGMRRLLCSIEKAYYDECIDLIISLDNCGNDSVVDLAESFNWKHGEKYIVTYPKRLGLRKHILHCGDFVENYDAIVVLEDDLVVSPGFFLFMKATVEKYSKDSQVAGISLYSNLVNQTASQLFEPAYSEFDVFFMQYAHSWGQIWMKKQWFAFKEWYLSHCEPFGEQDEIPKNVRMWPESSWLKYHIRYCIMTNKYFVYPYKSLSTCFCDAGQHNNKHNNLYQVPLLYGIQQHYSLPNLDEAPVKYDAFYERVFNDGLMIGGIKTDEIIVDLSGARTRYFGKRYVLSTQLLPYKAVCSFGLELHPIEMNVIEDIQGDGILLYDTNSIVRNHKQKKEMSVNEFVYRWKLHGHTKDLLKVVLERVKGVLFR